MNEQTSEEILIEGLDELIFVSCKLDGMRLIRERRGCDLQESLRLFSERYGQLRAKNPEKFACSHEIYWKEFHS